MLENIYLVLSVRDLTKALRVAKRSQKLARAKTSHTIVLNGLKVVSTSQGPQLTSCYFDDAVREVEERVTRQEQENKACALSNL